MMSDTAGKPGIMPSRDPPHQNPSEKELIMRSPVFVVSLFLALAAPACLADISDIVSDVIKQSRGAPDANSASGENAPGADEINRAVLDALSLGVQRAIELLGREGGFLDDAQVRIPMPDNLLKVEQLARKFGQDKYADRFIASMNKAAEQAVPETSRILLDAIKSLKVADARAIVTGDKNAATAYFQRVSTEQLREVVKPLVSTAMEQTRVTRHYKKFVKKASFLSNYVDTGSLDLDEYVTDKALEGLFSKLAEEEARIRADPVARGTDILKSVFGYFGRQTP